MAHKASRKAAAISTAAIFYCQLLAALTPSPAQARVEPLNRIVRQIQKPNMLIVLDTSGSLTGVPGGSFDYTDEVGVDCDNGVNCRGGTAQGTCALSSSKLCTSDAGCQSNTCEKGAATCVSDSDCMPISGKCATGQACTVDNDCPAQTSGTCATSNKSCTASKKCTASLKCKYDNITCSNDSDCLAGYCADNTTRCATEAQCAYNKTGGTCTLGTTPMGGCSDPSSSGSSSTASNCPLQAKVCNNPAGRACTGLSDCGGTCSKTGTACTTSSNCMGGSKDTCDFTGKTCASPTNTCLFQRQTCTIRYTDNVCKDTNPCVPDANPCTGAAVNHCLAGTAADHCNIVTTSGGPFMCKIGQDICIHDSDCSSKISGDTCGLSTSRMVIAKRVIRNVVAANANIVNLGLMTFHQSGYFPYYPVATSGSTTSTSSSQLKEGTLRASGCYSKKIGLQSTCTVNGESYTLRPHNNAKYLIKGHGDQDDKYVDADYCGWFCDIPGVGTGVFKGGYYDYTDVQGTLGAKKVYDTYHGKVFTDNGVTYRYYDSRPDYYNGGSAAVPPIDVTDCSAGVCSATCGGRWDTQLAPFLSTDDSQATIDGVITAVNQTLEPAGEGGLIAYGGTPTGCTLENNGATDRNHSAYHYMQDVKNADTLSCRLNYVLFITDGEANGPGDTNCTSSACSAADPQAAGCTCKAVLAAQHMRQNLGVKTFVVGFSTDAATGAGHVINDNIAKAGGTDVGADGLAPYSFAASNESGLTNAIQGAIYQAIQGSYSTSPATASQGVIHGSTEQSGNVLLDSRVDFPTWKGHLVAYDVTTGTPLLTWDAATRLGNMDWRKRRVYTRDASNNLILIDVDPTTGAINNKGTLYALGMGGSPTEAEQIARWMLGDPLQKNPAILGSIINSTPIDVGPPADGTMPGAHRFYLDHQGRPSVTYIGSDDGMLHGFYTRDVTVRGVSYTGGDEAFAYLPRSMLQTVTKLYAQGGQLADPAQHIYGLASSAKVKSVCVDHCEDDANATWKTTLVMTEGWGGNGVFMLDITDPVPTSGTPFKLLWSAGSTNQSGQYANDLGYSVSVPAFTFVPGTGMNDQRVIMASGYPLDPTLTNEGRVLVSAQVQDGTIRTEKQMTPGGTACTQDYAMLTDVATARKQMKDASGVATGQKQLVGAYFGDTWGNLWGYSAATDSTSLVNGFGCQQPLHFSPTVVQMDADDPSNSFAGQIFLVQVTNSSLDHDTEGYTASKMVIFKLTFSTGAPTLDTTFGTNGSIVLSSGVGGKLCGVSSADGATCLTQLPSNARPLATPTGIIKPDGTGFVLLSNWYAPATGCGKGATYLQLHDFSGGTVSLKQALKIADEPVVNPIIVNGNLMVSSSNGPISINGSVSIKVESSTEPLRNTGDPFQMSGWTEIQ